MAQTFRDLKTYPFSSFTRTTTADGTLELSADISDLGPRDPFCQIYPDACDYGFAIRGEREEVIFSALEERDREGEITHYVCEPISESLRKTPQAARVRVILIND